MTRCRYCPRLLRTKESKDRGYGVVCGRKRGLIPLPTPRHARLTTPVKPVTTPGVHPGQTTIPIQPELPKEAEVRSDFAHCPGAPGQAPEVHNLWGCSQCNPIQHTKIEEN